MRRFITLASAVTAATLWVVACSSSSDNGGPSNTGGSGGSGGTNTGGSGGSSSDTPCVGSYADLTLTTLTAGTVAGGMCVTDVATICSNDVTAKAESCGLSCLSMGATDMDGCVGTCINGAVSPPLGAACLGCYTTDVGCARDHCALNCIVATSAACTTCRQTNGCISAFYACSGLPIPGASAGGGSGGAASASAGAGG